MIALENRRPLQIIFPSSTTKPQTTKNRRQAGYKKIRWKNYNPDKKSLNSPGDQFVQWQPPDSLPVAEDPVDQEEEQQQQRKPAIQDETKESLPLSKARLSRRASPVEPLPLNGTRVNPFLALPIKSTETVQDSMDYFISICGGTSPGPINPHLSLLLPYALENAILFESIISVCRASILISLGRSLWDDYAFVHHRGSAIAGLNRQLKTNEATDNSALLTVTMLMTLEYLCGDQRGVLMHRKGLDRMLELRGPLGDEDDPESNSEWIKFVKHGLTAYKALGSFVTGQAPEVPRDSVAYLSETFQELQLDQPLSYPEPPLSADLCVVLSRLPPGLSELSITSQISIQMIKLLASISAARDILSHESINYENLPSDDPSKTTPSPESLFEFEEPSPHLPETSLQYDEDRKEIMIQTLLSSLQRMSLTSTRPVEYHLTSGLLAFLIQLRSLGPINLFYDPILRNFITTLAHHAKSSCPQEQKALIWASMSVAGTLALRVVSMPESHLVMDHALELYPQLRQDWPSVEALLRTYFWTEKIGSLWRRVWEKAMGRRQFLSRHQMRPDLYREIDVDFEDTNSMADDDHDRLYDDMMNVSTTAQQSSSMPHYHSPTTSLDQEVQRSHQGTTSSTASVPGSDVLLPQLRLQSPAQSTPSPQSHSTHSPSTDVFEQMSPKALRAHVQTHIAGAPKSIFALTQAMGLCPMRAHWDGSGSDMVNGRASSSGSCSGGANSGTGSTSATTTSTPISSLAAQTQPDFAHEPRR